MSEIRPHFRKAVRDGNGNLRIGATVLLLVPGTSDPITAEVFSAATGPGTRGSTWITSTGIVDFYLDDPTVVDIKVTPAGGGTPVTFANQWVGDAENLTPDGLNATGALAGEAPVADGNGGWAWGPIGGAVSAVNGESGDVTLTPVGLGAVPATTEITAIEVVSRTTYDGWLAADALSPTTIYIVKPPVV